MAPFALLFALLAIVCAITIAKACASDPPPPPADPPPISASALAQELRFNSQRTAEKYQDSWFTVTAGPFTKVSGRTAQVKLQSVEVTMTFASQDDAWNIEQDSAVTAVCHLKVWTDSASLHFSHCRQPTPPLGNSEDPPQLVE